MELIKIVERDGQKLVSARELYDFLGVSERFSRFMERNVEYGLVEGVDYTPYQMVHPLNKQEFTDFALTLDAAKEIAMLQRTEKGKQARLYFIECEKKLLEPKPELTKSQIISQALLYVVEENEELKIELAESKKEIQELLPDAEYTKNVLKSDSTWTVTVIAAELGLTAIKLNKILHEKGIQFSHNGIWIPYAKYKDLGFTKTRTHIIDGGQTKISTVWTELGRKFLHNTVNRISDTESQTTMALN